MLSNQEVLLKLSDQELIGKLHELSDKENEATVEVLLHLAEVDRRKLYLPAGYSSLFTYCTQSALKYSEPAAQRRISCARVAAKFPELVPLLINKELTLSTLSLVANTFTGENKAELLKLICGKSKREVEEVIARYNPRPKPKEVVKPLTTSLGKVKETGVASLFDTAVAPPQKPQGLLFTFPGEGKQDASEIKTETRYELRFSIDAELKSKLDQAKLLLSGKYPRGVGLEELLAEALTVLLKKKSPEARSQHSARTTKKVAPKATRHIPQQLRDQVYHRDGGRCAFVGINGQRCAAQFDLEVHHLIPYAKGGKHSLENLQIRCRLCRMRHKRHYADYRIMPTRVVKSCDLGRLSES